jgi:hypothetical protein
MKQALIQTLVFLIVVIPANVRAKESDDKRRREIETAINADPKKLLGTTLADVTKRLKLEKVSWDKGYTNYPNGEMRIYHFPGYYLGIHLVLLLSGITPNSHKSYSTSTDELHRNGIRWLDGFYPFIRVDNLSDPKERMKRYWKEVHRGFDEKRLDPETINRHQRTNRTTSE